MTGDEELRLRFESAVRDEAAVVMERNATPYYQTMATGASRLLVKRVLLAHDGDPVFDEFWDASGLSPDDVNLNEHALKAAVLKAWPVVEQAQDTPG